MIPQGRLNSASNPSSRNDITDVSRDHDVATGTMSRPIFSQPHDGPEMSRSAASIGPSATRPQQATFPSPSTMLPSQQSQKKRRVLSRDYELLQSWGAPRNLAELVRRSGGEQQCEPSLELPRIQLLKDACETGDLFYVVAHQVFCTWSVNPSEIRGLFQHDAALYSTAEHGMRTLSTILKDNANMRPELLGSLANFPAPFANMRKDPNYSAMLNAVLKFLFCMATSWTDLMSKHAAHGFPLLMDELLRHLHMYSDVLQIIVFRASRRTSGVPDGPIGTRMESLFREDQDFHRSAEGHFMPKPQDPSYNFYNERLVNRYKELVQSARAMYSLACSQQGRQQSVSHPPYSSTPINTLHGDAQGAPGYAGSPVTQNQQWTVLPNPNNTPATINPSRTSTLYHSQPAAPAGVVSPSVAPWTIMHAQQPHTQPAFVTTRTQQSSFCSPTNADSTFRGPSHLVPSPTTMASGTSGLFSLRSPPIQTSNPPIMPSMPGNHIASAAALAQSSMPQTISSKPRPTGLLFPSRDYRIPVNEYPSDQYDNNCIIHTLHQAHIRSPKQLPDQSAEASERHYQSVRKLALRPVSVAPKATVQKLRFHLSDKDRDRLTYVETMQDNLSRTQRYRNGSLQVRVRCCYVVGDQVPGMSDSEWVMKHVTWPEHIFLEINNTPLSIRRKAHYSKDLPVDIAASALAEENYLNVWVPEAAHYPRDVPKDSQPYLAVELVETLSHSAILSLIKTHGVQPRSTTLGLIEKRLVGSKGAEDDEIAMMTPEIAIDLADPFSSGIFTIPVRGIDCTHLECFDLEIWLNSRLGKRRTCVCSAWSSSCKTCPSEPSFVDKWKCPLCSSDARPYSLRIDEWLSSVRDKLEADGNLKAKSILVSADGTWKIKELPLDDEDDKGSDEDVKGANLDANPKLTGSEASNGALSTMTSAYAAARSVPATAPVVIEIDDD